ncbi:hypothetical protein SK128_025498 [Halocaridina rubra]|uniref:Uncharacterized protein n=1 Tax=Halocaridina rubra TaxID=373956 RepID=A0AAN8WXY9_HALRR
MASFQFGNSKLANYKFVDSQTDTLHQQINIKAGFKKCGLVPFDPEALDYTMLTAAASQTVQPPLKWSTKEVTRRPHVRLDRYLQ